MSARNPWGCGLFPTRKVQRWFKTNSSCPTKWLTLLGMTLVMLSPGLPPHLIKADEFAFDTAVPNRGWFKSNGEHTATNDNTATGMLEAEYRSFYVWDVSSLAGMEIVDVRLRMGSDGADNLPVTVGIFDVSHDRDQLTATYHAGDQVGQTIFVDLGTGNQYGSFVASSAPDIHEASLPNQVVQDLQNAISSGLFAIGLRVIEGGGVIRFDQIPRIQQLVVTAIQPNSAVLVTNLLEPVRDNSDVGNVPGPAEEWGTQSFFTDGQSYRLDSIQAPMGNERGPLNAIFELRRSTLNHEIDMTPTGLITTFAPPDLTGPIDVKTFVPASDVALEPNTQYWFLAGVVDQGGYQWSYADTGNYYGPGSLSDYGHSDDMGSTWYYPVNPYFPFIIQVNVCAAGGPVCPSGGTLVEGTGEVNDFNATCGSDDVRWAAHGATFAFSVTDPVAQFELKATVPAGIGGSTISVDVEASKANINAALFLRANLFNFVTDSYVAMPGILTLATDDELKNYALPAGSNPADFIEPGTNEVRLLLQTIQTSGLPNVRTQLDEVLFKFE